jgi:hypothetical protein
MYPAKLSSIIEREIKISQNKKKLEEFMNIKPAQQKMLKGILHRDEEDKYNQENIGKNTPC